METQINGVTFSDDDIINKDDFIPQDEYNPHNIRPFVIHDHSFVIGVVFTDSLDDALDILVDEGKLEAFKLNYNNKYDVETYGLDTDEPSCVFLGNAGEPFDIETLDSFELANPPFSFVAMFEANR